MRLGSIAAPGVLAVLLAACSAPAPAGTPSEAEARGFLAGIVRFAQAGDFAALCDLGGPNCEDMLEAAGRDAVPVDPPRVAGTRTIDPDRLADGTEVAGGLVLQLCGVDGRGRRYAGEVLVLRDGSGRLRAVEPVYWSGMRIVGGGLVGGGISLPGCPSG